MNVIAWLEFEHAYHNSAVRCFNHYTTRTRSIIWFNHVQKKKTLNKQLYKIWLWMYNECNSLSSLHKITLHMPLESINQSLLAQKWKTVSGESWIHVPFCFDKPWFSVPATLSSKERIDDIPKVQIIPIKPSNTLVSNFFVLCFLLFYTL